MAYPHILFSGITGIIRVVLGMLVVLFGTLFPAGVAILGRCKVTQW